MEPRFGHDFSRVQIYSGAAAEKSAREVNANAYTVGNDIVFGAGLFAPATQEGRQLIAHELTHVVQQSGSHGTGSGQRSDEGAPTLNPASSTTSNATLARTPSDDDPGFSGDPKEAQKIGSAGEREEIGRVRRKPRPWAATSVYSKADIARMKSNIDANKPNKPPYVDEWLTKTFPDGRARPEIVAIDKEGKRILVLDLTARPGSTATPKPGDLKKLPVDASAAEQAIPHLEKTKGYGQQAARGRPKWYSDYSVTAQDRYWTTGDYSVEVKIPAVKPSGWDPTTGPPDTPTRKGPNLQAGALQPRSPHQAAAGDRHADRDGRAGARRAAIRRLARRHRHTGAGDGDRRRPREAVPRRGPERGLGDHAPQRLPVLPARRRQVLRVHQAGRCQRGQDPLSGGRDDRRDQRPARVRARGAGRADARAPPAHRGARARRDDRGRGAGLLRPARGRLEHARR